MLSFFCRDQAKSKKSKFCFKDIMRTVPRNIPMKFHRSNMKTEGGVRKSLKFGLILQVFGPKSGLKSKNSEFRVNDLMRTVSRNIPMKFHHSNMKSEGGVRKSLKSGQILIVFRPKSGLKSKNSKFCFKDLMRTVPRKIPIDEVSSL
jgi:hypothetical protein